LAGRSVPPTVSFHRRSARLGGHLDSNQNKSGLIAKRACSQGLSPLLAREAAGLTTNERIMRSETASVWARVRPIVLGAHAFALADQAVASCTSFLALVMIGRATSADELGVYAIAISILIWLQMSQEMLVTLPYTVQRHHPLGTPTEHAGSSLFLCGLLSALAIVVLAATASGMSALNAPRNVISITWVLAAVAPFALLREFGRRFSFAHLRAGTALVLDIAVAVTQLGLMGWLAWIGFLSATTALGAIGIGCAVTGATWLYFARRQFVIRRHLLPRTMRESWSLGKW